jgi:hypothetical protein
MKEKRTTDCTDHTDKTEVTTHFVRFVVNWISKSSSAAVPGTVDNSQLRSGFGSRVINSLIAFSTSLPSNNTA